MRTLQQQADPANQEGMPARQAGIAIAVGLILIVLIAITIRHTELVSGQYISNGVPPLPALAFLISLSLLRPFLRRHFPRLAPTRAQTLLIYCMLTIGVILCGVYHIRGFLPNLVALQYWGSKAPTLAGYARYLPAWYAPHDMRAINRYYDGGLDRSIPWHAWLTPLACWSLFFLAMFLGIFSLVSLIRRQWIHHEKLSFPLLTIPLALTAEGEGFGGGGSLKSRRTLFLLGFGVAALFDGINIVHALYPPLPGIGFSRPLLPITLDRPWTPLQSVQIYFMLEAIGIGYFVPLEISFSTWFFYVLHRVLAVTGTAAGYDDPGFPYVLELSAGGYVAMGLLLLWGLRRALGQSLHRVMRRADGDAPVLAERRAWIGVVGSALFLLGFCRVAGLSLWLAVPYFAIVGLFVLVYVRMRAEAGVPFMFIYPDGMARDALVNTLGVHRALALGGTGSFVLLASLGWLARFHHPEEQAAYQFDSVKLSEEARISRRTLFIALLLAFVVGLGAATWAHLSAYYAQGSNLVASAGGFGEYRERVAHQDYDLMASRLTSPPPQSIPRLVATAGGFCLVWALTLLRQRWLGFPLHPLGFLLATAQGDTATSWFPMLVAWLAKATLLRAGGLRLYRRGIPFFLGLAIGHFFIAGILWPMMGLFIAREAANGYHLVFGE